MAIYNKKNYLSLSDLQLVSLIVTFPCDMDAAYYLLYDRCNKVLRSVFWKVFHFDQDVKYKEVIGELLIHLEKDGWSKMKTYNGSSKFESWIWSVAENVFFDYKKKFYELKKDKEKGFVRRCVSMDTMMERNEGEFQESIILSNGYDEEAIDKMLVTDKMYDAIDELEDDYRFVVERRLDGFNSREIADMLIEEWKANGVKKHKQGKLVVPNDKSVNEMIHRAKEMLCEAMS